MSFFGTVVRLFLTRFIPLVVLLLAILLGWINQSEIPMGKFFAALMPLLKGYKPPNVFGHGKMVGTPPVPNDMMPEARPEHESFVELIGGDKMPQNGIGMCCRPTAYDDVLVERSVLWYLLMGGRLIDGAELYLNHKAIGMGIKEAIRRGVPRDEIFITSKVWTSHYGYNTTKSIVPTFLDELGIEYIDLVLMHQPAPYVQALGMSAECNQKGLSNKECRQETWKALSELREAGIIRNAGVSNFATRHLMDLRAEEFKGENNEIIAPVVNNQIQWDPWAPQEWVDTVAYAKEQGIIITAYNSLGGSLQSHETQTIDILTSLAAKHNRTVAQIMLRWAMQGGAVVIPGTGNPKYMRENLSIYEFELSDEEIEQITNLRHDDAVKNFFSIKPLD